MKIGTLVPQRGTGRMDIRFSPNDYYGGLHCGETLGQHRTIVPASLSRLFARFFSLKNGKYIQYSSIFQTLNWNKNPS